MSLGRSTMCSRTGWRTTTCDAHEVTVTHEVANDQSADEYDHLAIDSVRVSIDDADSGCSWMGAGV